MKREIGKIAKDAYNRLVNTNINFELTNRDLLNLKNITIN